MIGQPVDKQAYIEDNVFNECRISTAVVQSPCKR